MYLLRLVPQVYDNGYMFEKILDKKFKELEICKFPKYFFSCGIICLFFFKGQYIWEEIIPGAPT